MGDEVRQIHPHVRTVPWASIATECVPPAATAFAGGSETAKQRYSECMSLAPGTIWSVYAGDELQKL